MIHSRKELFKRNLHLLIGRETGWDFRWDILLTKINSRLQSVGQLQIPESWMRKAYNSGKDLLRGKGVDYLQAVADYCRVPVSYFWTEGNELKPEDIQELADRFVSLVNSGETWLADAVRVCWRAKNP